MSRKIFMYALVIINCYELMVSAALAFYIKPCMTTDEECLKTNVENVISKLADGDTSLEIPSLEPLKISNSLIIKSTTTMPFQNQSNIVVSGLTKNTKVESIAVSLDPCHIHLKIRSSNVLITCEVVIKGKFYSDDIDIADKITMSSDFTVFPIHMKCEIIKKNNLNYLNITSVAVDLTFENLTVEFLNKQHAVYIPLLEDPRLYGAADLFYDALITDVSNKIFNSVPVNHLFIE